jgi:hypothetical protein
MAASFLTLGLCTTNVNRCAILPDTTAPGLRAPEQDCSLSNVEHISSGRLADNYL